MFQTNLEPLYPDFQPDVVGMLCHVEKPGWVACGSGERGNDEPRVLCVRKAPTGVVRVRPGAVSRFAAREPAKESPADGDAVRDRKEHMGDRVTYEQDIRPLFRDRDIQSISFAFDLTSYEDVRANAEAIYERLAAGSMPCDGLQPRMSSASAPGSTTARQRNVRPSRLCNHTGSRRWSMR